MAYASARVLGMPVIDRSTDDERTHARQAFDRWLAQHDREVAARALREAADAFQAVWPVYGDTWLRDRADRIERGDA